MSPKRITVQLLLGILVFFLSFDNSIQEGEVQELPSSISIVFLGRKGSGITSTLRQLLGPKTEIHAAEEAVSSTDILEYTLRLPPPAGSTEHYYLKLIDVPGLDIGDNLEHDAEILASLKSYLHDKGLPTFFIVVSRFDDQQFGQPNSAFVQLLKRVKYFQRALFHTSTDNTIFLFTRLLSESPENQKSPQVKIDEFRKVIEQQSTFPQPLEILVGDNKPDNATVEIENGFFKFPNGELYPKNIWDKLLQVAEHSIDKTQDDDNTGDTIKHIIKSMIEGRENLQLHTQELVAHAADEDIFESDLEAFEYLLRQENVDLPHNEVQDLLVSSYEKQDATTQIQSCLQLLTLQLTLRNMQLQRICQIPQTVNEEVKFFQDVDGMLTSKYSLFYLKQAFDVEVPDYPRQCLAVGFGYDLLHDRLLQKSPFLRNPVKRPSSSLGYQFPDFVECERLPSTEEAILANVTDSLKEYHEERLKLLSFSNKNDVVLEQLKGETKPYLNLKPSENGKLIAVKEIRILECKMSVENESLGIISDHFTKAVNTLPALNTSDPDSLVEWNFLLRNYGTHIVTKAYGGGSYQANLILSEQSKAAPEDQLQQSLTAAANFEALPVQTEGSPIYIYNAGDDTIRSNPSASHINEISAPVRSQIMEEWKRSLNLEFKMLSNDLELVPLSQIISVVNAGKRKDAEDATRLFLQGSLKVSANTAGDGSQNAKVNEKRATAKTQAHALQLANLEKTLGKFRKFDKFLEEHKS